MKRMIACEKCAQRKVKAYEGEWFKRVFGTAKEDFVCDWCGNPDAPNIKAGDRCAAESMGIDGRRGIPYYPWEDEYIEREDGKVDFNEKIKKLIEIAGTENRGLYHVLVKHDDRCRAIVTQSLLDCTCDPVFEKIDPS